MFLIFELAGAAPAPCPVPAYQEEAGVRRSIAISGADPVCRSAQRLLPEFARLRAAAGFAERELPLQIWRFDGSVAFFSEWFVALDDEYLVSGDRIESFRATLAHEVAHAVQARGAEGRSYDGLWARLSEANGGRAPEAWRPADRAAWESFSMRYEAQATAIGQQLLAAAGFSASTMRRGDEDYYGCPARPKRPATPAHPSASHALINNTLSERLMTHYGRLDAAAFDGARGRRGAPAASAGAPRAEFRPAARLWDFDERGRFLPGRLIADSLRVPAPPRSVPLLARAPLDAFARARNAWAEAVGAAANRLARGRALGSAVLRACGSSRSDELARDLGLHGWIRRASAEAARRTASGLRRRISPAPDRD